MLKKLFLFCIFLFSQSLLAADIGLSTRALGMGNAFTAIVNDTDSVFYNPAGLAKMKAFQWTLFDAALGTNTYDSYQDYLDIAEDSSDIDGIISGLYGSSVNVYAGGKSVISFGGLTFGAYGLVDAVFDVHNPVFPNIDSNYRVDYGFLAGWGMNLIPEMLDIGLLGRRVTRTGGHIPIGVSTIATLSSDAIQDEFSQTGTGYAFDWGATLTFPGALKPTIAFTWRDMGNTKYYGGLGQATPAPTQQEHILGLGLTFDTLLMSIKPALDFRYLNDSDMQIGKKIGVGVEISWPLIDVRAGLHQGYYALGASFDLWFFRVDAATYGQELGEYPGQLEDRRYMLQFSLDFGIDPGSFELFDLERPSIKSHNRKLRR
ncbi:MAG: hypothetical protein KDD33_01025 [Bdellovibrionales bacterium]|nr:hypothetical protein [Bdellovibrionales bacterium]